jgi:hypothetical protein
MKKHLSIIKIIASLFIAVIIFSSCEKVIDIDLKEAEPKLVIEGRISTNSGPYRINLSTSGGYFDTTAIQAVSNGLLTITDESGNIETLIEVENGVYETQNFQAFEETKYKLDVEVDGKLYQAEVYLPNIVNIISMEVVESSFIGFGNNADSQYDVKILFTDPIETEDYYMFSIYRNGVLDRSNFRPYAITDDTPFNGLTFTVTVPRVTALPGDEIFVELHSIDFNTYEYFRTLNDVIGGGMGSTPYNPIGNISNGALGYFGSFATDSDSKIIE